MYPNIYCKKKYYGNQNNLNPYMIMQMPTIAVSPSHTNLQVMAVPTQKLHALAPPFQPMRNLQQQQQQQQPQQQTIEQQAQQQTNSDAIPHNLNDFVDENDKLANIGNFNEQQPQEILEETKAPQQQPPLMSCISLNQMKNNNKLENSKSTFHPLQYVWTLWYLETDRSKTWEEMQNEISSIDNVEDFWRLYNHIKPASEIKPGCDYSLFKNGTRPMWEDQANREGGRWILTLPRGTTKMDLDSLWLDVLLCMIGETFENSDQICGAVLNVRSKNNKISIWTTDGQNESAILEIGYKLRDVLRFAPCQLHYQLHKDTMTKGGSGVKSIYVIQ